MPKGHDKDTVSPIEYVCLEGEAMTGFKSGGASHEVPGTQHKGYQEGSEHLIHPQWTVLG